MKQESHTPNPLHLYITTCPCNHNVVLVTVGKLVSSGLLSYNGSTPLDVATATIKNNRELVLALGEAHLEHVVQLMVATTTSVRNISSADSDFDSGMQFTFKRGMTLSRTMTMSASMDWSPSGGGKCLEFLQSAVWVEGKVVFFFELLLFLFSLNHHYSHPQ